MFGIFFDGRGFLGSFLFNMLCLLLSLFSRRSRKSISSRANPSRANRYSVPPTMRLMRAWRIVTNQVWVTSSFLQRKAERGSLRLGFHWGEIVFGVIPIECYLRGAASPLYAAATSGQGEKASLGIDTH